MIITAGTNANTIDNDDDNANANEHTNSDSDSDSGWLAGWDLCCTKMTMTSLQPGGARD